MNCYFRVWGWDVWVYPIFLRVELWIDGKNGPQLCCCFAEPILLVEEFFPVIQSLATDSFSAGPACPFNIVWVLSLWTQFVHFCCSTCENHCFFIFLSYSQLFMSMASMSVVSMFQCPWFLHCVFPCSCHLPHPLQDHPCPLSWFVFMRW